MTDGNEWVRSTHGEMSAAPAGWAMPRSLRTVRSATQSPPPAESPARTIFSAGTALCGASGGGLVKYKSETFIMSVAGSSDFAWSLHAAITSCLKLVCVSVRSRCITKIIGHTMDTARGIVVLFDS